LTKDLAGNVYLPAKDIRLFVSVQSRNITTDDGYTYRLTPQFSYLYFYLVLKRLDDPMKRGGFVEIDEILLLSHWERNSFASAGKQIRRHIIEMTKRGRNIIDAQQKISGPFTLIIPSDHIQIDAPITKLMDFLDQRHISRLAKDKEVDFYNYVECMWEGDAFFNDGLLKDALPLYKEAEEAAAKSKLQELKIAAMQKIGRTLERLGDLTTADRLYQDVLKCDGLNEQAETMTYVLLGLIKYRQGDLKASEKFSYKALDMVRNKKQYKIMGGIYNGLGLVRKERKQYEEALIFFQRALEFYSLVDYFYGIQAVYFNIGLLYKLWGDQWSEQSNDLRNAHYTKSMEWVYRCISLCEKMGIGFETSQDYILLASIQRKMGNMDKALEHAKAAIKIAGDAGNMRDMAYAHRIRAVICLNMGKEEEAKAAFKLFITHLGQSGLSKDAIKKIAEENIKKLAREMSSTVPKSAGLTDFEALLL